MECSLFLHRRKVACSGLEEWVARLLPNCLDIRLGMKAQRDGIQEELKRRWKWAAPDSSDLEVEIVETARRSSKRAIKQERETPSVCTIIGHCFWLLFLPRVQVTAHCILSPSPTPLYQHRHQDHHRRYGQQSQLQHQSPQPHPAW